MTRIACVDTSCIVAIAFRERVPFTTDAVGGIGWILPDRPLSEEAARVATAGYLRGADAWHLACALFVTPTARDMTFVTMDGRQREAAKALGFAP